jgi:hypothetical protein
LYVKITDDPSGLGDIFGPDPIFNGRLVAEILTKKVTLRSIQEN